MMVHELVLLQMLWRFGRGLFALPFYLAGRVAGFALWAFLEGQKDGRGI